MAGRAVILTLRCDAISVRLEGDVACIERRNTGQRHRCRGEGQHKAIHCHGGQGIDRRDHPVIRGVEVAKGCDVRNPRQIKTIPARCEIHQQIRPETIGQDENIRTAITGQGVIARLP